MKTECPVCGQIASSDQISVGSDVRCRVCRTGFEAREIIDPDAVAEKAEQRAFIINNILPLLTLIVVLVCGIGANVLHQNSRATTETVVAAETEAGPTHGSAPTVKPDSTPQDRKGLSDSRAADQNSNTAPDPVEKTPVDVQQDIDSNQPDQTVAVPAAVASTDSADPSESAEPMNADINSSNATSNTPTAPTLDVLKTVEVQLSLPAPLIGDAYRSDNWIAAGLTNPIVTHFDYSMKRAISSIDSQITYTSLETGDHSQLFSVPQGSVVGIDTANDLVYATTIEGQTLVSSQTGEPEILEPLHSDSVTGAHMHRTLYHVTCGLDNCVYVRGVKSGNRVIKFILPASVISSATDDGRQFVFGCSDRSVLFCRDPVSATSRWSGFRASGPIRCLAIAARAGFVAVGGGNRIELRSIEGYDLYQLWETSTTEVTSLALSYNARLIAIGCLDGSVLVADTINRTVLDTLQLGAPVTSLHFEGYNKLLGIGTADGELTARDIKPAVDMLKAEDSMRNMNRLAFNNSAPDISLDSLAADEIVREARKEANTRIRSQCLTADRSGVGIRYLLRDPASATRVVAMGKGLDKIEEAFVIRMDGELQKIDHQTQSPGRLILDLDYESGIAPVIGLRYEEGLVVTVPLSTSAASEQIVGSSRDDEAILLSGNEYYETLEDDFRVLLLLDDSAIKLDITGSGLVIAAWRATLPETTSGQVSLIRSNNNKPPQRRRQRGAPDIVAEKIFVCPIPPVIVP